MEFTVVEKKRMMMLKELKRYFLMWLVLVLCAAPVHATFYPFEVFTDNGLFNDDPGLDFYMDVSNGGAIAEFTFYNDSTVQSSITNIYFDDGTLLGATMGILNGPGTLFTEDGPTNIPGGNMIGFDADREFNIGADPPPPVNGVNNIGTGEWVTVQFLLVGGTLDDVLNELNSGALRVGIHVQDFTDGTSESAVNVPEPATMILLGLGALVLRKRRN